jgi:hypothetical protein
MATYGIFYLKGAAENVVIFDHFAAKMALIGAAMRA